jgi:hypothetical protein
MAQVLLVVVLFIESSEHPITLGISNIGTFYNLMEPLQAHLAVTSQLDEMRFIHFLLF